MMKNFNLEVKELINNKKFKEAERICLNSLEMDSRNVEIIFLLSTIAQAANLPFKRIKYLQGALKIAPENIKLNLNYIWALCSVQEFYIALELAKELHKQFNTLDTLDTLVIVMSNLNQLGDIIDLIEPVVERGHIGKEILFMYKAALASTQGDSQSAELYYKTALLSNPEIVEPWIGLSDLKIYKFTDADIFEMQKMTANINLDVNDRVKLLFSLGRAFEQKEEWLSSFSYYKTANDLKHNQAKITIEDHSKSINIIKRTFNDVKQSADYNEICPIFIVGLPRSGSTLIEQILSSHSLVDGTKELLHIPTIVDYLSDGGQYPEILDNRISKETLNRLSNWYFDKTKPFRNDAQFFTDKMPTNFKHIGLIKILFPNSKIIDARRNVLDCGFSCYKQLFNKGYEFSYNLTYFRQYYELYEGLMNHWKNIYPEDILTVHHENLLQDSKIEIDKILQFVQIPYEEQCFKFYETKRKIFTPSSQQVRKPINTDGVDLWKPYEQWLEELLNK